MLEGIDSGGRRQTRDSYSLTLRRHPDSERKTGGCGEGSTCGETIRETRNRKLLGSSSRKKLIFACGSQGAELERYLRWLASPSSCPPSSSCSSLGGSRGGGGSGDPLSVKGGAPIGCGACAVCRDPAAFGMVGSERCSHMCFDVRPYALHARQSRSV